MKRGYLVKGRDPVWGVPIVAHNAKEAKRMAWDYWEYELDCEWVDLRVTWRREAVVEDLQYGFVIDYLVALRHKLIDCWCR